MDTALKNLEAALKKSSAEQQSLVSSLLNDSFAKKDIQCVEKICHFILTNQALAAAHSIMLTILSKEAEKLSNDEAVALLPKILELMKGKTVANEKAEYAIRWELAKNYAEKTEYALAARALADMHIDQHLEELKVEIVVQGLVKISEYLLYAENTADAYTYITRAAQFIDEIKDKTTQNNYISCYAHIHDANLKFSQAASMFYDLSLRSNLGEREAQVAIDRAITCTLLAPPGNQRSRLLTLLYKDERTRLSDHFELLEKMYLERFIKMSEVKKFEEILNPYQKSETPEGYTVLQKAVLEHNVLALSKIYTNISIDQLSKLLEITTDKAEGVVSVMISEGKIKARINQLEKFIYFESEKEMLQRFNELIGNLCEGINTLITETSQKYPKLANMKLQLKGKGEE